jgi:hypothetical protein
MIDPNQIDITTRVINSFIEHWPMLFGLGVIAKYATPWAIKTTVPPMVKVALVDYFNNGGGDKMRSMMKEENEKQSVVHKDNLDRRIREHEVGVEAPRFQALESGVANLKAQVDELGALVTSPVYRKGRGR